MQAGLSESYAKAAQGIGRVARVGDAWSAALAEKDPPELFDADGSHPSLAGTYLAACVVYSSLYGKSPVGNAYDYFGKVDKATAAFLQQVAWETVTKFYAR